MRAGATPDAGLLSRPSTACVAGLRTPQSRRPSLGGFASIGRRKSLAVDLPAELRSAASDVQKRLEQAGDDSAELNAVLSPSGTPGENVGSNINLMPSPHAGDADGVPLFLADRTAWNSPSSWIQCNLLSPVIATPCHAELRTTPQLGHHLRA